VWIQNQKIIGNDGIAAVGNLEINTIAQSLENFENIFTKDMGGDLILNYRKLLCAPPLLH